MSLTNLLPNKDIYHHEILKGLSRNQKDQSSKLLYDKKGSALFEEICKLKEYYLTRAENEILESNAYEMSKWIGTKCVVIEPRCGSCEKIRYLLDQLKYPHAYVPMDISSEILIKQTDRLREEYKDIPIFPIITDYTANFSLTKEVEEIPGKRVVFFPGSTIGNLTPDDAIHLISQMGNLVGPGGGLLIGVDLKKNPQLLKRAYKYTISEFTQIGEEAGFRLLRTWQDHRHLFCVYYFEKNAWHI